MNCWSKSRPTRKAKKIIVISTEHSERLAYGKTHDHILKELTPIKEHQKNTNIDLYHLKLDLFKIMESLNESRLEPKIH